MVITTMKKELKELIKSKKLSDDDIMKLIQSSLVERDIKDEDNEEAEEPSASNEGEKDQAEEGTATESPKGKGLTAEDIEKLISDSITKQFATWEEKNKPKPRSKEPAPKRTQPNASTQEFEDFGIVPK